MSILSNKLEMEFHRENIDKDFDIYVVSKEKGHHFKSNILDKALVEFKAKSVVYTRGTSWYVLFGKNELDSIKFKKLLEDEEPECIINKIDIMQEKSIYPNVLAQLLFNTLAAPARKDLTFNNVTGKLYYFRDAFMKRKGKTFYALEVKLSFQRFLALKVKTFSCIKYVRYKKNDAKYLFDEKSGRFRKQLRNDKVDDSKLYVEKAFNPEKKNNVHFLDFDSYEKFCNSKVGVYVEFMEDVQEVLSDYITVKFGGYEEYYNYSIADDNFENQDYGKLLREKGVCIIDEVNDEKSKQLLEQIRYELETEKDYQVQSFCNCVINRAYVIRIIHEEEYYKKQGIYDPHEDADKYGIVQHMTIEKYKPGEILGSALKKVVQELLIKKDIMEGKFSTVNWDVTDQDLKFVKGESYWVEEGNKKEKYYRYCRIKVQPEGTFTIDKYNSYDFTEDEEWNLIDETYKKYDQDWKDRDVEGIVYYDCQNMNVIMRTEQTTLPNLFKVSAALKLSNKENLVNVKVLKDALREFKANDERNGNSDEMQKIEMLLNECKMEDIKIKDILDVVGMRNKKMQAFNEYLCQTRGILLHMAPKTNAHKEEYFNAVLDIKHFYSEDKEKLYYFVGTKNKSLQMSLNNACVLREVVATGGEIIIDDLMKLLAVEFVRNGQYTVVPFVFKYINEVMEKERKKRE